MVVGPGSTGDEYQIVPDFKVSDDEPTTKHTGATQTQIRFTAKGAETPVAGEIWGNP